MLFSYLRPTHTLPSISFAHSTAYYLHYLSARKRTFSPGLGYIIFHSLLPLQKTKIKLGIVCRAFRVGRRRAGLTGEGEGASCLPTTKAQHHLYLDLQKKKLRACPPPPLHCSSRQWLQSVVCETARRIMIHIHHPPCLPACYAIICTLPFYQKADTIVQRYHKNPGFQSGRPGPASR